MVRHLGLPPHGNFQGRADIFEPDYSARGRPFLFTIQGLTSEDGLLLDDKRANSILNDFGLLHPVDEAVMEVSLVEIVAEVVKQVRGHNGNLSVNQVPP